MHNGPELASASPLRALDLPDLGFSTPIFNAAAFPSKKLACVLMKAKASDLLNGHLFIIIIWIKCSSLFPLLFLFLAPAEETGKMRLRTIFN